MKILQIIYSLNSGGAERFVVDLSNELAEMNHEVVLCTLRDEIHNKNGFYKSEISSKVVYINLKLKEGLRPSNILFIGKLIQEIKPDIVQCHLNLVNYIFPLTIIFPKIKFFHTIHSDAEQEVMNKLEYYLRKFFYSKKIVEAITISNTTTQSFVNYYRTEEYKQILNGRKKPLPSVEFKKVKNFVDELKIKSKYVFLHIGRCNQVKNQKMLIKVFNRLNDEQKSVTLIIVGAGFESSLGNELKSMASDNIYFIGEKKNVTDYFLNADAFCLSSFHEGMPITLIEAFACGCVPVCTPVGGISDSIKNGITGYLSKSVSEEDYYDAIISFINNKGIISKENLIEYYNSRFSIGECACQHIELFKSEM
jgi:glycosyltransferase involved in cell wall biosynthesis